VGAHLRAVSRPHGIRAGCLVVDVRDVAWKRELERLKPQILPKIAERMPGTPIGDITFRVRSAAASAPGPTSSQSLDRHAPRAGEGATRDAEPLPATEDLADLFVPLARIADLELRARLRGVASRYLVRTPSR
jgi:Dna[CI] antecedent DciA-like protein